MVPSGTVLQTLSFYSLHCDFYSTRSNLGPWVRSMWSQIGFGKKTSFCAHIPPQALADVDVDGGATNMKKRN